MANFKEDDSQAKDWRGTYNIFENMIQSEYDRLCLDEECKKILDGESDRIGQQRIEEAMNADDWMTLDEFGGYMKKEILLIFHNPKA